LVSLRSDKFDLVESVIKKSIHKSESSVELHFDKVKITKENQANPIDTSKDQYDLMLIVHKVELRTLLLGKNGYFNNIVELNFASFSK